MPTHASSRSIAILRRSLWWRAARLSAGSYAMGRGAAGVPTGSVRNARHCRRARCRVRRARCRVRRARYRVNGRPARRFTGRQHGPGDDESGEDRTGSVWPASALAPPHACHRVFGALALARPRPNPFCNEFPHSPQASAKRFQQRAEFLPLRNRGLGPLAVTILPVPFARRAAATACAAVTPTED
jgi:hypothetical protein